MRMQLTQNRAVELADLFVSKNVFIRIGEKSNLDNYSMNPIYEEKVRLGLLKMSTDVMTSILPFEIKLMSTIGDIIVKEFIFGYPLDIDVAIEYVFLFTLMLLNNTPLGKSLHLDFEKVMDNYIERQERSKKK